MQTHFRHPLALAVYSTRWITYVIFDFYHQQRLTARFFFTNTLPEREEANDQAKPLFPPMRSKAKRKFSTREDDEYPGEHVGAPHQPEIIRLFHAVSLVRSCTFQTAILSGDSIIGQPPD